MKYLKVNLSLILIILSLSIIPMEKIYAKRDVNLAYETTFKTKYQTDKTYFIPSRAKIVYGYSGVNLIPVLVEKKFEEREFTGFVIETNGYAIIPYEPLKYFDKLEAEFYDGVKFPITVIGSYPPQDIALVKLENYTRKAVVIGDSDKVEPLDEIWSYGFQRGASKILSSGIISSLHFSEFLIEYPDFFKTEMSINPGVEAAPVFNENNEVIGICRWNVDNFGTVEPINHIMKIIEKLKINEPIKHSWLGIYVKSGDKLSESEYNIPANSNTLYVASIFENSPAEKAGLKKGDIIIGIDNQVFNERYLYIKYLMNQPLGKEVTLKIKRDNTESEIKMFTEVKPEIIRLRPLDELLLFFGMKVECDKGKPMIVKIFEDSYAKNTNLTEEKQIKYILPKEEIPIQKLDEKDKKFDNRLDTEKIKTCEDLEKYIRESVFDDILFLYLATENFLDKGDSFLTVLPDYFPVL
ncbi:MAG: S1C family serine protease [bacterium]|nr:S1C family serine protease [bacterium]